MTWSSRNDLAPHAVPAGNPPGRVFVEPALGGAEPREPFELDRHRIIGSTAFRRLEGKTQVFAPTHHDHFRTRLTHTLEVAQIARCLARRLGANESLAEAVTLAHDLGHPPFGHAGEVALNDAMSKIGGFNHNAHSLRVVEYLEHPFPPFRGLNLTAETRAGLAAHETQYDRPAFPAPVATIGEAGLPCGPSVEAQIASIADRIAYDCHDLEDGIGADLITLDDLARIDLWSKAFNAAAAGCESNGIFAVRRAVLDAVLNLLLNDVIETSRTHLATVRSPQETRSTTHPLVALSPRGNELLTEVERLLTNRLYRCSEIAAADERGRQMVFALADAYRQTPANLPNRFQRRIDEQGIDRVVCDYVAGMTDRFCRTEYARLNAS